MVLEASRQHIQVLHNASDSERRMTAIAQGKEPCKHCESPGYFSEKCWTEHLETALEWYKLKMKEQAKGKGKGVEQVRKYQAKLTKGYDFVDNNSTHISA